MCGGLRHSVLPAGGKLVLYRQFKSGPRVRAVHQSMPSSGSRNGLGWFAGWLSSSSNRVEANHMSKRHRMTSDCANCVVWILKTTDTSYSHDPNDEGTE